MTLNGYARMTAPNCAVPCVVCGDNAPIQVFRPRSAPGPVVRCGVCGMVFISPRERTASLIADGDQYLDRLGPDGQSLRHSSDLRDLADCWELADLGHRLPDRAVLRQNHLMALEQIGRFCSPPGRLLDFGSGWGFFLDTARGAGWDVQGIEPLPGRGIYARSALGLPVVTDTLRPDTFPAASFDVVTAFQVFEHLPDPAAEIAKIHHVLRPGGLVAIEVPNIDTLGVRIMRGRHRHFVIDHLWFFGPATLRQFLANCGFEPLATSFPTRLLSVRHLVNHWAARGLPPAASKGLQKFAERASLMDRSVRMNLGDIVMVIGRKIEKRPAR